jgi:hypothetical protein
MNQPAPWHQHPAIVVLALVCFWPAGLALLWAHPTAPKWVKIAASAWIAVSVIALGAAIDHVVRSFG